MRKGLCTLIDWAKLGCQIVGTAENGLQAKQAVLDYQPDIIIADIKMPVMDGLELARWVCGAQRQIQIILLTAFADFSYAQQAIQYGVSDYVTKTGNMNDIVAAVERCKQKLDQQRVKFDIALAEAGVPRGAGMGYGGCHGSAGGHMGMNHW